jgi:hypothetical protein
MSHRAATRLAWSGCTMTQMLLAVSLVVTHRVVEAPATRLYCVLAV